MHEVDRLDQVQRDFRKGAALRYSGFLLIAALALVAGVTGAWLMARWQGRSVARIARSAERLAAGDWSARVGPTRDDELGRLGRSLDRLAEKVQEDIAQLRRSDQVRKDFTANVSHELRTPLAAIKAFAETSTKGRPRTRNTARSSSRRSRATPTA